MVYNWNNFLSLAEELHNSSGMQSDCEAIERTAISRSYYAAYHYARINAEETGYEYNRQKRGSVNDQVREWIEAYDTNSANLLSKLYEYRINADYYDEFDEDLEADPARIAEAAIIYAKQIITELHLSSSE
jgi:uncharacterized protein (UPF0332 family)